MDIRPTRPRSSWERNPYFWQVDTEGNQLPYVDTLDWAVVHDNQALVDEAVAGNIDMQRRRIDNLANLPQFGEHAGAGGYLIQHYANSDSNRMAIHFNHTHPDPVMRALIRNRDVRIALSLGIDRQAIINTVYLGVGEPWQIGPRPEHALYNEQLGRQFHGVRSGASERIAGCRRTDRTRRPTVIG